MRCCCVCGLRRAFARLCLIDVVCVAGTLATRPRGRYRGVFRSAVCAKHPMVAGTHYVEVTVVEKAHPTAANAKRGPFGTDRMGLVGEDFNAVGGGIATTSEDGWLLSTHLGAFVHDSQPGVWYGMVKVGDIKAGDVVGLLLDLEQRTLLAARGAALWWCRRWGTWMASRWRRWWVRYGGQWIWAMVPRCASSASRRRRARRRRRWRRPLHGTKTGVQIMVCKIESCRCEINHRDDTSFQLSTSCR